MTVMTAAVTPATKTEGAELTSGKAAKAGGPTRCQCLIPRLCLRAVQEGTVMMVTTVNFRALMVERVPIAMASALRNRWRPTKR